MFYLGMFNKNVKTFYARVIDKSCFYFRLLITTSLLIFLSACGEHYEELQNNPEINYFEVVDSYGYSNLPLNLFNENHGVYARDIFANPFINDGYFELWWDISHYDTYSTKLYINDKPTHFGAYELEAIYCNHLQNCNMNSFAYCFYNSEANNSKLGHKDTLSCSTQAQENGRVDITPLFYDHPQALYLIIKVCDEYSGICERQSQKITFE